MVTITDAFPAVPLGVMQVKVVAETILTLLQWTPPMETVVPVANPDPEMLTFVPPKVEPVAGDTLEIEGAARYVNP